MCRLCSNQKDTWLYNYGISPSSTEHSLIYMLHIRMQKHTAEGNLLCVKRLRRLVLCMWFACILLILGLVCQLSVRDWRPPSGPKKKKHYLSWLFPSRSWAVSWHRGKDCFGLLQDSSRLSVFVCHAAATKDFDGQDYVKSCMLAQMRAVCVCEMTRELFGREALSGKDRKKGSEIQWKRALS